MHPALRSAMGLLLVLIFWSGGSSIALEDAAPVGSPSLPHLMLAPAPEFPVALQWLNTDRPLRLRELRGKVVLLDFWTYGCINCLHILPDLQHLEATYARELVVIGVHSATYDHWKAYCVTNNHCVRVIDLPTLTTTTLPLYGLALPETIPPSPDQHSEVMQLTEQSLPAASSTTLHLDLRFATGWQVNEQAGHPHHCRDGRRSTGAGVVCQADLDAAVPASVGMAVYSPSWDTRGSASIWRLSGVTSACVCRAKLPRKCQYVARRAQLRRT